VKKERKKERKKEKKEKKKEPFQLDGISSRTLLLLLVRTETTAYAGGGLHHPPPIYLYVSKIDIAMMIPVRAYVCTLLM